MIEVARIYGLAVLLGVAASPVAAAEPRQSSYLDDVRIDMTTVRKFADESDNFALSWHTDGALYGAYGDGWGFTSGSVTKRAIGVSRITGTPPHLSGTDVWAGAASGQTCCWLPWNGKSWGMVSTGADGLHMWFTIGRPRLLGFLEARLASSTDDGRSWTKANWAFMPADRILMPSFLQIGRGQTSNMLPGGILRYVYSYSVRLVTESGNVQSPGQIDLMRVARKHPTVRSSYEFFAGTDSVGNPIWTKDLRRRVPVMEKPNVLDAPPTVAWNPYLGRYIMVMGHVPANDRSKRGVGFYEASQPWGPWYKIKELDQFAEGTIFFYQFPTKWMSPDLSAWMAFTGPDKVGGEEWDALNVVKTRFVLTQDPT